MKKNILSSSQLPHIVSLQRSDTLLYYKIKNEYYLSIYIYRMEKIVKRLLSCGNINDLNSINIDCHLILVVGNINNYNIKNLNSYDVPIMNIVLIDSITNKLYNCIDNLYIEIFKLNLSNVLIGDKIKIINMINDKTHTFTYETIMSCVYVLCIPLYINDVNVSFKYNKITIMNMDILAEDYEKKLWTKSNIVYYSYVMMKLYKIESFKYVMIDNIVLDNNTDVYIMNNKNKYYSYYTYLNGILYGDNKYDIELIINGVKPTYMEEIFFS